MGVDEMGVDKMRVDEMGVDKMGVGEMGTYLSKLQSFLQPGQLVYMHKD